MKALSNPRAFVALVLLLIGAFAYIQYSKRHVNNVKVLVSTPQLQSVNIGNCHEVFEARDYSSSRIEPPD